MPKEDGVNEIIENMEEYTAATGFPYDFSPEEINGDDIDEGQFFYNPETGQIEQK